MIMTRNETIHANRTGIQAVLFDLGDTLFDLKTNDPRSFLRQGISLAYDFLGNQKLTLPPKHRYIARLSRGLEFAYVKTQITHREIRPLEFLYRIHRKLGIDISEALAKQVAAQIHEPIRRVFNVAPGAYETVRAVSEAGYSIGLVSNTMMFSQVLDRDLASAGMLDFFDVRVYSSDVGYAKPHPQIFRKALDSLGVSAAQTAFVGDLIKVDVKGAQLLGMTTVLIVPDGRLPRGRYRPDHLIRRITELPRLLPRCHAP